MAFKIVIFFAAVSMAAAGVISAYDDHSAYYQPAQAVYKQATLVKQVEHEEPANYDFKYEVHDPQTGDVKQQHETSNNGAISGQYSLIEADGQRRIVDYTADDVHGFNANVRRESVEGHQIVKTLQPAIAVQKVLQPAHISYSAPQEQYYSAPNYYHH